MSFNELGVVIIISTLEHVFKNIRYKLLYVDGKYYVYDMDRLFWSFIFPFFYWFIPHPVYQIDEATYEKLKMPDKEKGSRTWIVLLAAGMSIILVRFLSSTLDKLDHLMSFVLMMTLLVVFIVITIGMRVYLHRSKYKQMNNKVNLSSLPVKLVNIKAANKRSYILAVYYYLISLGLSLLCGFGFIETSNFFVGIIFVAFTLVFTIVNTLVIPIGSVKVTYVKNHDEGL